MLHIRKLLHYLFILVPKGLNERNDESRKPPTYFEDAIVLTGTSVKPRLSGFGGLEVRCWPLVPKFAGSNPAEAVGFFRAKKILSTPSFGREVKPFVPCRRFTACKRSLNVTWKSGIFRQNSSAISRPSSSFFHY